MLLPRFLLPLCPPQKTPTQCDPMYILSSLPKQLQPWHSPHFALYRLTEHQDLIEPGLAPRLQVRQASAAHWSLLALCNNATRKKCRGDQTQLHNKKEKAAKTAYTKIGIFRKVNNGGQWKWKWTQRSFA